MTGRGGRRARRAPGAPRDAVGRVDPCAEQMAIDSALEAGAKLILANMLALPPYPLTVMLAPQYATLPHEEDRDAVRATARELRRSASPPSCCGSRAPGPSGP